jgi:Domain of unknown function (DUF5655)
MWACPKCRRKFTRANQRHACGTGEHGKATRNRSNAIVNLYAAIESFAKSLGPIEVVTGDRYVLLRSVRIFADLVIMAEAVRVAVHLSRKVDAPIFFKVAADRRFVTHVAKLKTKEEFEQIKPFLKEAYRFSLERA